MRIIIIGAQAAGMSVAAKAKRMDKTADIVVYEASDITSFGACGLPYYVGGEFDDPSYMSELTPEDFAKKGITVKTLHTVESIDPAAKTLKVSHDGKTFEDHYDRLMIATGGSAIIPPIENVTLNNVLTLKTMNDGLALREIVRTDAIKTVTVIGAGFIGLELVEALVHLGKTVHLFEREDRIMPEAFEPELSALLLKTLENHESVHVHLNESVTKIEGEHTVTGVTTSHGHYPSDLVVVCTGVHPNTAFLKESGLAMLQNGAIRTNEYGQTNVEHIYAAGDCATVWHAQLQTDVYSPLATGANKLGRIIGENIVGGKKAFKGLLNAAAVQLLSVEAGRVGLSSKELAAHNIPHQKVILTDKNHANYCKGQAMLTILLFYHPDTKVILGAQVFGENGGAVHRMHALSVAIMTKLTTDDLAFLDFAYAPPFARVWDALNIAGSIAK